MIKVFFKTIWNQRSKNVLVFLEFFLIFLVLSNLSIFYSDMISVKMIPNCYDHQNVVKINIYSRGDEGVDNHKGIHLSKLKLSLSLNEFAEFVSVSRNATPFNYSLSSSGFKFGDEEIYLATRNVDIDYGDAMNIKMLKGRWFDETDRGKAVQPAIIGRLAEEEFFHGNAMGERFGEENNYEVVGVVDAFKRSDIEKPYRSMFRFIELSDTLSYYSVDFLVRVKEGKINDFLEIANREVFNVLDSRYWAINTLNTLENQQADQNMQGRVKRLIVILIVSFVVVNIVLGIIGILWYNTNLRTHEIGIKRAMGSHGKKITAQIILENTFLAVISSVPVIIILAQADGLRMAPVKGDLFLISQAVAFSIMVVLVLICTWIPARIASKVRPALALKYE